MSKYIKRPVAIEACQLPMEHESAEEFLAWAYTVGFENYTSELDGSMEIDTLEGPMCASPGDYVIKGIKGEFYACKPDIFAKTYYTEAEYAALETV